jgi:hypothetical protein
MSFTSEINDIVANRTNTANVPDIDTAAGSEVSANPTSVGSGAGAISGSQQFNPLMNPNLVPPVTSSPNPSLATPIGSDLGPPLGR